MKTGLYKEMSENKSILQEKSLYTQDISQNISTKHSFNQVFHQQILKRNFQKKNPKKRNLYQIKIK